MRKVWPAIAGFEDGKGGHEPRNAGSLSKLEETRKWIPPRACRKSTAPPTP